MWGSKNVRYLVNQNIRWSTRLYSLASTRLSKNSWTEIIRSENFAWRQSCSSFLRNWPWLWKSLRKRLAWLTQRGHLKCLWKSEDIILSNTNKAHYDNPSFETIWRKMRRTSINESQRLQQIQKFNQGQLSATEEENLAD